MIDDDDDKNTGLCRNVRVLQQQVAQLQRDIGVMLATLEIHNYCLDEVATYMKEDTNATANSIMGPGFSLN